MKRTLRTLAWSAALLVTTGCGQGPVVGLALPLTGADQALGVAFRRGVELALQESGRDDVTLVVQDTGGEPQLSTAALQRLDEAHATVVIGPLADDRARPAALLCQAVGLPMIAPTALDERVAMGNEWVFRFGFARQDAAAALATHARYSLDLTRLALVIDLSTTESVESAAAFAAEFRRRRGRIVAEITYWGGRGPGPDERGALLGRVAASGAEGAFIPAGARDVAAMIDGADASERAALVLLGMSAWDTEALRSAAAGRVAGAYFAGHFAPDEVDTGAGASAALAFARLYREREGGEADGHAALGYDVTRTVLAALGEGASRSGVRSRLAGVRRLDGATGTLTLDAHGSAAHKSLVLQQAHDPSSPRFVARLPD